MTERAPQLRGLATRLRRISTSITQPSAAELQFKEFELMMAVGIMYTTEGGKVKILAERKKGVPFDKSLKLPGGHYEPDVDFSLRGTLKREFREETGEKLTRRGLVHVGDKSGRFDDKNVYMRVFMQEFPTPISMHSEEADIEGYEWVSPEEFKQRSRHTSYRLAVEAWEDQFAQQSSSSQLSA